MQNTIQILWQMTQISFLVTALIVLNVLLPAMFISLWKGISKFSKKLSEKKL